MPEKWWKYSLPGKEGAESRLSRGKMLNSLETSDLKEMLPENSLFADLHIHSNKCGNASKPGDISRLAEIARRKGLSILGTGDLTNKKWREIVYSETAESDGLQYSGNFPFVLSVEVATNDKSHHLLILPDRATADALFSELSAFGKIEKMGRPFLSLPSKELARLVFSVSGKIELIPAHVWTPHFGLFGEGAHYNSLEDAFGEFSGKIRSIETGLSSNPEMNRRIGFLNGRTILSFSDCHAHTLLRIGREATAFPKIQSYREILSSIRKNRTLGTVEVFPEFGKYHFSGHRDCEISLSPESEKKEKGICPKCNKSLTRGVEARVTELQEKSRGIFEKATVNTLPIPELASVALGTGVCSKKVLSIQNSLVEKFGSELSALLFAPEEKLSEADPKVARAIVACREGKVSLTPGFDGVYGKLAFQGLR